MEKNKQSKIIGLSVGILGVLIIVVSSTYAYWQITRTQKTPNDIVAACLNLDLNDASAENRGIDLDSAWPISDEEGKNLTGYTFTVTNNCNEEINYIVGLNRVEEANYLQDTSIKLQLDDNSSHVYGDLSDVEYADAENTEYTARTSKQVSVESISANGINTHTIRVWVSSDAPVTEQSKTFLGQIFITGGQGIEVPVLNECFTIANDGTITGYNYECGVNVKVPAEINGIRIKHIQQKSFAVGDVDYYTLINNNTNDEYELLYLLNSNIEDDFLYLAKESMCENPETCTIEDIKNNSNLIILLNREEFENFDWENYTILTNYLSKFTNDNLYGNLAFSNVESLDLSEAVYLEDIENLAFAIYEQDTAINDTCVLQETSGKSYYNCNGFLKELILPQNGILKEIGSEAFASNQLTNVTIPYTMEIIGEGAFSNNEISTLIFEDTEDNPSKLETIGDSAFGSNNITKVVLPGSLITIGSNVFYSNNNLSEIILKRENSDGMTLGSYWNCRDYHLDGTCVEVTYDPNYTE